MPEFMDVNRIINFLILLKGRWRWSNIQNLRIRIFLILEIPYFIVISAVNWGEFAVEKKWEAQSREGIQLRNLKFPIVSSENSMQIFKEISRTKHLRILRFWTFDYLHLPFNNIKRINNSISIDDFCSIELWNTKILWTLWFQSTVYYSIDSL